MNDSTRQVYLLKIILVSVVLNVLGCTKREYFTLQGGAMAPTITPGEVIEINHGAYENREPARYDVVAFRYKGDPSNVLVMRVMGLPKERILVSRNGIFINGAKIDFPNELDLRRLDTLR